ncbi:SDR family oxidoreductase [Sorangium sp. So ce1036]|uniref:SDR family oxidoreductase n=1 Tax=Sorangium sp. So ce1036 TaxID=3133328 RepID=UPI003EFD4535
MTTAPPDLRGKTVLITGANQGIGKAAAVELARKGAKLVLLCRNPEKARAAMADIQAASGNRDISLILADLSSLEETRRAAAELLDRHDRLDVLLNNAGVITTSRRLSADGHELTFATNHLGAFLLTKLLLDRLKASPSGRIVNVSSEAHRRGQIHFDDLQLTSNWSSFRAYCQSKLANILFTSELARRLDGTSVTANSLHPGVVASGFGRGEGGAFALLVKLAGFFMISPEKGAITSVYLCSSPEVAGVSGKYFDKCKERSPSVAAQSQGDAKRLWDLSEELTA